MQRPWGWSDLGCQRSNQDITVARAERMGLGIEGEWYGGREANRISMLSWGLLLLVACFTK